MEDIERQVREFRALLEEERAEQVYQQFLEQHTRFIPHEFVQNHGVGVSLALRKLRFGADYVSDFFYFSKSSDDWNAVFIELEKPSSKFFAGNTTRLHRDFDRAIRQINQWRAWFLEPPNKAAFLASVSAIQVPRHMANNPTYNKYVLVFGRRAEYENNPVRRRLIKSYETDDFKIITYDSLLENVSKRYPLSIGSRHNEFIDILTDEVTDAGLFSWVEASQLRVSQTLLEKMKKGGSNHLVLGEDEKPIDTLLHAAPKVRVRPD